MSLCVSRIGIMLSLMLATHTKAAAGADLLQTPVDLKPEVQALGSCLADLAKRHRLPLRLDEESFRALGVRHFLERDIQLDYAPVRLRLDSALSLLTQEMWEGDVCVDFQVQKEAIVVRARLLQWELPYDADAPADPALLAQLRKRTVTLESGIDEGTPLQDALDYLADRHGVRLVLQRQAFRNMVKEEIAERAVQLPPVEDQPLEQVLKTLLNQVDAMALVRPDHVLIVPKLPVLSTQRRLDREQAEVAWDALGSADARAFFTAGRLLWADRAGAVRLLGERLRPAESLDPVAAQRWLADLESKDFQVREQAAAQLELAGDRVERYLVEALLNRPSLDARRRIEQVEDRRAAQLRRLSRAVLMLERIATPEARQQLAKLAQGEARGHLTAESIAALCRLDGKPWIERIGEPEEEEEDVYRLETPRHARDCPFPAPRRN